MHYSIGSLLSPKGGGANRNKIVRSVTIAIIPAEFNATEKNELARGVVAWQLSYIFIVCVFRLLGTDMDMGSSTGSVLLETSVDNGNTDATILDVYVKKF